MNEEIVKKILKQFKRKELWSYYSKAIDDAIIQLRNETYPGIGTSYDENSKPYTLTDGSIMIVDLINNNMASEFEIDDGFYKYYRIQTLASDQIKFSLVNTLLDGQIEFYEDSAEAAVDTLQLLATYTLEKLSNNVKRFVDTHIVELLDIYRLVCSRVYIEFISPYISDEKINNPFLKENSTGWSINIILNIINEDALRLSLDKDIPNGGVEYRAAQQRFEESSIKK